MIEYTQQQIGKLDCVVAADSSCDGAPDAVVILCHGFGAPGTDLVSLGGELLDRVRERMKAADLDLRFIFPAAPLALDPVFDSRAWWMIDIEKIQRLSETGEMREMRKESPSELPACREMINEVIEFAKAEYDVPASRIAIGGFSQGAMLSTDVALHCEPALGGLIVWSGALICESDWKTAADDQEKMAIAQSHGTIDPILPFAGAKYLHEMLMGKGHAVDFVEFRGQHAIPGPAVEMAVDLIEKVVVRNRAKS